MTFRVMDMMARDVIAYNLSMRWEPDARGRLQRAAFELFSEQGFAATTVPQITARAGLTTRTFFRHFVDKREVVFGGTEIPDAAAAMIRATPPDLDPMDTIRAVLHEVATTRFDGPREQIVAWRRIIEHEDALRDRDARKRADLVQATQAEFEHRGVDPLSARLFAELGAMTFQVALDEWVQGPPDRELAAVMDQVLDRLATVR
jgi:AcrR family transcriptional regulator